MSISRAIGMALGLAAGLAALSATPASATTETVLHTMCSLTSCADGSNPQTQLLKVGNILYGVASGGAHGGGVVYQYDLGTSAYTVLYNFCSTHVAGHPTVCADGEGPTGKLIVDTSGNLYGTTDLGGNKNDAGTVYELVKPANGTTWTLASIYKFCPAKIGSVECDDGDDPLSGLTYAGAAGGTPYDGTSLLFGTTYVGGIDATFSYGNGIFFALQKSGGAWSEKVLYNFCFGCSTLCPSCSDGEFPIGQLVMDASNVIWGSTVVGGTGGQGVVYKLAPGANLWTDPWAITNVYAFCASHISPCTDGAQPTGVLLDAAGSVYGTTQTGGSGGTGSGAGTLFKLANSGGTWSESVKYNFCSLATCNDGAGPRGDLIMDGSGNIFGTTCCGGTHAVASGGAGTVWKYDGTNESMLYKFCPSSATCADGQDPGAGVTMDASANLYGVTQMGGLSSVSVSGVVYKLVP